MSVALLISYHGSSLHVLVLFRKLKCKLSIGKKSHKHNRQAYKAHPFDIQILILDALTYLKPPNIRCNTGDPNIIAFPSELGLFSILDGQTKTWDFRYLHIWFLIQNSGKFNATLQTYFFYEFFDIFSVRRPFEPVLQSINGGYCTAYI